MPGSFPVELAVVVALAGCMAVGCGGDSDAIHTPLADVASLETDAADAGVVATPDAADEDAASDAGVADIGGGEDAGADADAGAAAPQPERVVDRLPIEVLGLPAVAVATTLEIDAVSLDAAESAQLAVTINNLVGHDSAELWINEQGPIALSTPAIGLLRPTGGTARATLELPVGWLVAGENTFTFAYTRQVRDVSGYRVLGLELLLDEEPAAALSEWEEPAAWQPYADDPTTLEQGREYFAEISRDGGPTCARCHADSGADLQYYAFSNESIVARAMFHEFSRDDAEAIASYIRSLDVPIAGRPYDAPFQPGAANHGAAGAGFEAVLDDDAQVGQALYGHEGMPGDLSWAWPESVDTFHTPITVEVPGWFRWLPREIDPQWFTRQSGALATTEAALAADPSLENAHAFMSAAVEIGKEIMVEEHDHQGRVEVLRFAAVKLWDWSRRQGFDDPDHGFPDDPYGEHGHHGSPPYPYEVGFAFFEAAGSGLPNAMGQATEWWAAQIAADPGRGRSNGDRPLNWSHVLQAAEFEVGPNALGFLHLYGSWEESRGPLIDAFGEAHGPVRLLELPMYHLPPADLVAIWSRFLTEQARFVAEGGALSTAHRSTLATAWEAGCAALTEVQRQELRALATPEVADDLAGCP